MQSFDGQRGERMEDGMRMFAAQIVGTVWTIRATMTSPAHQEMLSF